MIPVSPSTLEILFNHYVHKTVSREEARSAIEIMHRKEVYMFRKYQYLRNQYKVILKPWHLEKKVWSLYIRSETSKGKTTGDVARDMKLTLATINRYLL